jgi:PDZ domain-containing protein
VSQMDQSKIDAVSVVLRLVTDYPREHRGGALVESVVPGCSAAGRLFPGDLILAIDGEPIGSRADASAAIEAASSGETLTFDVRAAGETQDVDLVKRPCGSEREPLIGVSLLDNFPFGVSISSGGVGGPSAGLMWALGLYDLLTPGDLTGGRTIAGTGQIDLLGNIHPIGGIGEKVVAAVDAGADVLLLPRDNLEEARSSVQEEVRLVPVSTLREALEYLEPAA